jgi:segregation and condensation protein B
VDQNPDLAGRYDDDSDDAPSLEESAAAWVPPWARNAPAMVPAGLDDPRTRRDDEDDPVFPGQSYPELSRPVPSDDAEEQPPSRPAPAPEPELRELTDAELRGALESILLVIEEPVTDAMLADVLRQTPGRIHMVLTELAAEYTEDARGFELRRAAGGWRLYTRVEYASYVERFVLDGQQVRMTQAALETLAVVAYKQPVTRSRVAAIRGVNCDGVIKTLMTRGLVEECGTEHESGAYLYRTTPLFLEKLGLDTVEELPPLAPFLPDNIDELDIAGR